VLLGHGNDGQFDETSIRAVNATSVFAVHQIGDGTGFIASALNGDAFGLQAVNEDVQSGTGGARRGLGREERRRARDHP